MERFPVTVTIPVQWGDLDALGHVNNTCYFRWFESARIALFRQVGLATTGVPEVGPILASTKCDFLGEVRFPAEVTIGTRIESLGTTSFVMEYGATEASDPERLVARGQGVIVLVDYRNGDKVPISDDLRRRLEELRGVPFTSSS